MTKYIITRDKFLSFIEMKKLLNYCRKRSSVDLKNGRKTWITRYMLLHLAFRSGLRVMEIAHLKIKDIYFSNGENYITVQKGKGGRKRDVYFDNSLRDHIIEFFKIKKFWGEPLSREAPFLVGRGGNHYTTTALRISFKNAILSARLPGHYSIHSARHTYATHLLSKTNNLRFVQKQLGHANLNMTALYADVLPEKNQFLANTLLDQALYDGFDNDGNCAHEEVRYVERTNQGEA